MAGYSSTPLIKKLGITDAKTCILLHAPASYVAFMQDTLGGNIKHTLTAQAQFVHAFYFHRNDLLAEIDAIKKSLKYDGTLWISWPKKSSGLQEDLDESSVRFIGLQSGLVDVKVAAIDETWSGLKFVYRKKDRAT